jgi:hypothetical protein
VQNEAKNVHHTIGQNNLPQKSHASTDFEMNWIQMSIIFLAVWEHHLPHLLEKSNKQNSIVVPKIIVIDYR